MHVVNHPEFASIDIVPIVKLVGFFIGKNCVIFRSTDWNFKIIHPRVGDLITLVVSCTVVTHTAELLFSLNWSGNSSDYALLEKSMLMHAFFARSFDRIDLITEVKRFKGLSRIIIRFDVLRMKIFHIIDFIMIFLTYIVFSRLLYCYYIFFEEKLILKSCSILI